MTACPKPRAKRKRAKRGRAHGLQRSKFKSRGKRTKKSSGALFWKVKDPAYRRWVRKENHCLLRGARIKKRLSLNDWEWFDGTWKHWCWGVITPAHVGQHQVQGAPDFGCIVPLCQAAHRFYDEHRRPWATATGYTKERMERKAREYGAAYVAQQGDQQ